MGKLIVAGVFTAMTGTAGYMSVSGVDHESYLSRWHEPRKRPPKLTPAQIEARQRAGGYYGSSIRRSSGGNSSFGGRVK